MIFKTTPWKTSVDNDDFAQDDVLPCLLNLLMEHI
jgi:hypothetical protein